MTWRVFLDPLIRFGSPGYRLFVGRDRGNEGFDLLHAPTVHHLDQNTSFAVDECLLDDSAGYHENVRDFLQAMSDAAWEIGIQPKQIESHASELKATKYHLEDMRKLALK